MYLFHCVVTFSRALVTGSDDDFLQRLSRHPELTTLILPWIQTNPSDEAEDSVTSPNLLLQDYYAWTATAPLCDDVERTFYRVVYRPPVGVTFYVAIDVLVLRFLHPNWDTFIYLFKICRQATVLWLKTFLGNKSMQWLA